MKKFNLTVDSFDSFGALLDHAQHKPCAWSKPSSDIRSDDRTAWTGTASLADAIAVARQGWTEGRARLVTGLETAAAMLPRAQRGLELDVAGAFPFIPAAIAGDPACMFRPSDIVQARRPIVRIALQKFVSSMVSTDHIINQGVAILSHIDALEDAGFSAEIECIMHARATLDKCTDHYQIRWIAKRAGEPLELDRLAYVIAHPSMFRRVLFACFEKHAENSFEQKHNMYGQGTNAPEIEHDQIYFPQPSDKCWATLPTALAEVEQRLAQFMDAQADPLMQDA